MNDYRLSELLDMSLIQRLAESNFRASGIPMSIIDAVDASILARAGWMDMRQRKPSRRARKNTAPS